MVDETEFHIMDYEEWPPETDTGFCSSCDEEVVAPEDQEQCPLCGSDDFKFIY